ncbi:MAG: tetratricopeptide repeat protein, partial [Planctomycetota bacterium]|nr:tetratricopeptide repeat protein [Planctomycetota bacterium]
RARLRGQPASDYQAMMQLLARARDELDRFYGPAMLAEAELLYDKSNWGEAQTAIQEVLAQNPSSARAWQLLGLMSAQGFNFDQALSIAERLDGLVNRFPGREFETGSALAREVEALVGLRQNDPDLAAAPVEELLERFPTHREGLALRAASIALRYNREGTEEALAEYEALSPGSPDALFAVGSALSDARQYEWAAEYLERAAERLPNWPPPLVELGLLELQSGRDRRAAEALRKVATLDPFNRRAANSLVLIEELLTYDTVESEHFIVRFRPGIDRLMAEEMLGPLEEIHEIVAGAIDHEPAVKTTIELMPDHEWFAVRITGMPAIHTIAAATGPVIAMEAPKIGPRHTGEYDWIRVIRHEYVHTVTLSRTRNRIPHWFTEAAAVYLEGSERSYSTCNLLATALIRDELFDMREINIAFVRPKKPTDRSQAYAQGHWMYEYIVERFGPRAPLDLMDLYAEGLREEAAMSSVFGISREQFYEDFVKWALEDVKSWGMLPSPSMRELRLAELTADDVGRGEAMDALAAVARGAAMRVEGIAAVTALDLDLPRLSLDLVNMWLEEHPEHPDLLEAKIAFLMQESEDEVTEEIEELLRRYAAARPVDPTPHRRLAQTHLRSADQAERFEAIPHLAYLDAREQKTPAYAVELARLHAARGEFDAAWEKAVRATQIAPFDPGLREIAATVALQRRDLASAEQAIEALTQLEPGREIHERRLEAVRRMLSEGE